MEKYQVINIGHISQEYTNKFGFKVLIVSDRKSPCDFTGFEWAILLLNRTNCLVILFKKGLIETKKYKSGNIAVAKILLQKSDVAVVKILILFFNNRTNINCFNMDAFLTIPMVSRPFVPN